MPNESCPGKPFDAPDIGAFYFEDALEALAEAGCDIGGIGVTLQPRQSREAAALAGGLQVYAGRPAADSARAFRGFAGGPEAGPTAGPEAGPTAGPGNAAPRREFRVVRYKADLSGGRPVYDILLTRVSAPA